jgi:DNA-binding transcriptional regulator YdaS (Cro superfamily)
MMLPILREAIERAGGMSALAKAIGVSRQAIYRWKRRIPAERVVDIEAATGIDRAALRPDIFGRQKKKRGKR